MISPAGLDTVRWTAHDFVRYGDGGVVAVASVEADTATVAPCGYNGFERDLRLGFGARVACEPPPVGSPDADSVFVEGEYDVLWGPDVLTGPATPVEVAALKRYVVRELIGSGFVADVGPVWTGNLWGPRLHYAVVGGVEYGAPGFATDAGPRSPPRSAFEVRLLGNPTRDGVAFDLRAPSPRETRCIVYDVLGRSVWSSAIVLSAEWRRVRVPEAALAAGSYVLRVSAGEEHAAVPFTVVR